MRTRTVNCRNTHLHAHNHHHAHKGIHTCSCPAQKRRCTSMYAPRHVTVVHTCQDSNLDFPNSALPFTTSTARNPTTSRAPPDELAELIAINGGLAIVWSCVGRFSLLASNGRHQFSTGPLGRRNSKLRFRGGCSILALCHSELEFQCTVLSSAERSEVHAEGRSKNLALEFMLIKF